MNRMHCDVLMVGGGMVGLSLAKALSCTPLRVIQIEAQSPFEAAAPRWDERNFALSHGSWMQLRALGVLTPTHEKQGGAIARIEVSSQGDFGRVRFAAKDYRVPALGLCLPARVLVEALETSLQSPIESSQPATSGLQRLWRARLSAIRVQADAVTANIQTPEGEFEIETRLLVGADGADSMVRSLAGIGHQTKDYQQTAIVCTVETQNDAKQSAFERLTPQGPVALLPVGPGRMACIFTVASAFAAQALADTDAEFLSALQARFGWSLGRFVRVGQRQAWPLRLVQSNELTSERVVLIGNAAQSIHPIGAQGFNLGLRDATGLARLLAQSTSDPGDPELLRRYADSREADRAATIEFSDGLVRIAQHQRAPIRVLRSLGFGLMEHAAPLKQEWAMRAMGYPSKSGATS